MSSICRQKKPEKITWQSEFDGVLSSNVCGKLIVELIKFLAFQRHQLPAPFDQIKEQVKLQKLQNEKREQVQVDQQQALKMLQAQQQDENNQAGAAVRVDVETTDVMNGKDAKGSRARPRGNKRPPPAERKKQKAIEQMDEILSNVEQVFKNISHIEQVLVVFGSTPVSPKESFLIKLPRPGFYDGRLLSANSCKRELFRKLVSCDLFSDLKQLSSTNLMVFIQTPRNSDQKWFLPKFSFKLPTRGQLFEFSLLSTSKPCNPEITHTSFCDFELSGIEPLEKTQDIDMIDDQEKTLNDSLYDDFEKLDLSTDLDEERNDHKHNLEESLLENNAQCGFDPELVWFQAPIAMRGFKTKKKHPGMIDDIWG